MIDRIMKNYEKEKEITSYKTKYATLHGILFRETYFRLIAKFGL